MAEEKQKIDLSMYGVAEIIKWCITRNNGRIPGTDTAVFKALQAALAEIRAKPLFGLKKLLIQSLNFWYLAGNFPKSVLTGLIQIPVVLAAGVGAWRAFQRRSWARVLLIPVLGIMGASVVVFSFARLSAPVMPYLMGLSVYWLLPAFISFKKA